MARQNVFISSFNAGELSNRLDARVDLAKYFQGCRTLENFFLHVEGGAFKRPGLYYVNEAKFSDKTTILAPFTYSNDQAYILEFGDYYIRFYTDGGRIIDGGKPVEVVTPYKHTDLRGLRFTQSGDILYITHRAYQPRMLSRTSHIDWTLAPIKLYSSEESNSGSYKSVDAIANSGGLIRITTTAKHGFQSGDSVTVEGVVGTIEANGTWRITVINATTFTLNGSTYVHAYVSGGTVVREVGYYVVNCTNRGGEIEVEVRAHKFETGDMVWVEGVKGSTQANGRWIVTVIDLNNVVLQGSVFGGAYSSGGTIRGAGLFLMHDITACADNGSGLIRVTTKSKHGFVEGQRVAIEGVVGCKEANGVWAVTLVDANNFDLQDSTFTNAYVRGGLVSDRWPAICGFSDERLYFGGSYKKPLSMFLSKPGDYYNFTIASADADAALEYPLLSGTMATLRWGLTQKEITIGTADSEWLLQGDTNGVLSVDTVNAKRHASNGSADIQAMLSGDAILYVQRGGRRVRELAYSLEKDGYSSPDLTRLAYHIGDTGFTSMAQQVFPDPFILLTREDGQMPVLTYNRLEQVVAWSRVLTGAETAGQFKSVAVIPSEGSEDQAWVVVSRRINGVTKQYIEYFMPQDYGPDKRDAFYVDSGLSFDGGEKTGVTVVTLAAEGEITVEDASDLSNGSKVRFEGVLGCEELNGNVYTVSDLAANTFKLKDGDGDYIDTSEFTALVANKTITKIIASSEGKIRVKSASHGLADDDEIQIFGVLGCVEANDTWVVKKIDDDWIELNDSVFVKQYLGGGEIGGSCEVVSNYFTGIDHLTGEEVAVCGDGGDDGNQVVDGGTITTTGYYNKCHIGLPYKATLIPMKPDVGGRYGVAQGITKRIERVIGRFEKTLDCKIGMTLSTLDELNFNEDGKLTPFTGDKELPFNGDYDTDGLVTIVSDAPLPCNITGLIIFAVGYEHG